MTLEELMFASLESGEPIIIRETEDGMWEVEAQGKAARGYTALEAAFHLASRTAKTPS